MEEKLSEDPEIKQAADEIAKSTDADVAFYKGAILEGIERDIACECITRSRRKNVLLILTTNGGDADTAYRIARLFQRQYQRFSIYVPAHCKSAGTIIALGANKLIIGDLGELGPIDVQMSKKDELFEWQSGLTVTSALNALHNKAYSAFEYFLFQTIFANLGNITLKTTMQVAANLTAGLFAPLYEQIDPMHLGDAARSILIGSAYGERLMDYSQNYDEDTLDRLTSDYPSHSFVIDREEAQDLFRYVEAPNKNELELVCCLWERGYLEPDGMPIFEFLSSDPGKEINEGVQNGGKNQGDEEESEKERGLHGESTEQASQEAGNSSISSRSQRVSQEEESCQNEESE